MSAERDDSAGSVNATYARLLDAAAGLFRAKGYAGTTTRELAAHVGIQKASMYHHIRSKDDLLYTLCVDSLNRITEEAVRAVASESDPERQLRKLISAHVSTSLADQDKHATMLMELRSLSPARRNDVVVLRDRYESLVVEVIQRAQAAGALRSDVTAKQLMLALLNLLNWTIFWYRPEGELSIEGIGSIFESIYMDGAKVVNDLAGDM